MKLLFDVGNSRVKWVWLKQGSFLDPGAMVHHGVSAAAILDAVHRPGKICSEILLVSVADPMLTSNLVAALESAFGVPVHIAESEREALGVHNGYLQPCQLGADRWLAMLAAFNRWRTALCVVDVGTAVTIDMVAADGRHQGGGIIPGAVLMHDALLRSTGRIRDASARGIETEIAGGSLWGRDTESCIKQGALLASVGLVDVCVRVFRQSVGIDPVLVLTGGDAEPLRAALPTTAEISPMLVFEGLALRFGNGLPSAT
jgi:type III pantothenate kinase